MDSSFTLQSTFSQPTLATSFWGGFSSPSIGKSSAVASAGGSGLEIIPTFDGACTAAFEQCVYAAIAELHALFSNNLTINLSFSEDHNYYVTDSKGNKTYLYGNTGTAAQTQSPNGISVSYAALKAALPSSDVLPATEPNSAGGADYVITDAYARMLGLSTTAPSTDSSIWFNEYYNWSYNQDCVNAMVHEITEAGMGRIGGLGDQNSHWSTMDLFRFAADGTRNYQDGRDNVTTYFSADGGATLSADNFWNEYNGTKKVNGNDTADFQQDYAVFGGDITGETVGLTQDELNELTVLGGRLTLPQDVYQGTGTNWETIGRWSIGTMPAEPEDAYIHIIAGGQVSVDYNVFVNSIGVSAGSDLDVGNSALLYATNGTKLSSAVTSSVGSGNDGLIDIETKAVFWAGNEIANRGTIELGDPINGLGAGKLTVLSALRSDGGGTIQLGAKQTNSAFYGAGQIEGVPVGNFNTITGAVTNVDNTITGGGLIKLDSLDNQAGGTIASSQINAAALQIDAVTFTNEGSLVADDNSTLEIGEAGASRTLTNSGSITIGTGSFATLAVTGTLTIAGSGQLILDGADNSLIMGAGTSALNTLINHSEIDAVASADIGFVYANNSTYLFLQNRGSILASSPGAVLTLNTGNYTVDSEGGLLSAYGGGTLVLSSEVDVGNNGELEAGAGGTVDVFQEVVSAVNKGQVVVQTGGVMNIENNGEDYAPIDVYAASGVHPGGMLTLQTGGVILGSIDFHGGGEFDDQSTNAFDFFVSGTGGAIHFGSTGNSVTFTNASGAADSVYGSKETLDLDGASVVAVGDGDAITLEAGTKNALTIQGVGDTIEFLGVSYAATDYVTFVGNGLRTGGTVTVDNSSGVAIDSFAVIGDYEPSQFRLSDDGGNLEVVGAAGLSRPTAYDFNGDGDADILWRDPTTGVDSIWDLTHSGGRIAVNPGTVPANSVVAGIGDFNNDGIADILWRNTTTGADSIWDMTPSGGHTTVNPGTVATSYAVAGVGDFNGDGIADILWRNTSTGADSLWDMTASGGRTAVNPGTVATAYVVAGVGDFNNDGIADILWRNTTTGADAIWDMNASGGHTAVNPGTVATSYVIAGVGDFNNDGIEDLLWRNTTTGADSIWDMTASGGHTAINPGTVSTSYQVAGVGDFNGDGIADILWRNSSTGANTIWEMNAAGGHIAINPGTVANNWTVAS